MFWTWLSWLPTSFLASSIWALAPAFLAASVQGQADDHRMPDQGIRFDGIARANRATDGR